MSRILNAARRIPERRRPLAYLGVFAVTLLVLVILAGVLGHFVLRGHSLGMQGPLGLGLTEALMLASAVFATLFMASIDGRPFADYGLAVQQIFRSNFWVGLMVGFSSISAVIGLIFLLHGVDVTFSSGRGLLLLRDAAAWGLTFLIVGISEEFVFRGYLQFSLSRLRGFWRATCITSAVFAIAHIGNPGESAAGLLSVFFFGVLFCVFLRRSGNLWLPIGFHAGWDWGQTFFYGVPDSGIPSTQNFLASSFHEAKWLTGGTVGPEASILTPLTLLAAGILFSRLYSSRCSDQATTFPASAQPSTGLSK
jgi:membrane protease YdiL (CAAX protease family)